MAWYFWMALAALLVCALQFIVKLIRLVKRGAPKDLSTPKGKVSAGVLYSATVAMMPQNKESAYLHLPTYVAGILYHIGTFLSLLLFVWIFVAFAIGIYTPNDTIAIYPEYLRIGHIVAACILFVAAGSGISVLIKRLINKELRFFSSFDDYFSNFITTAMQLATAIFLLYPQTIIWYCVVMTLAFLWMPVGKTKHALYFFAARYHLGFFYGRRGVWPPAKIH
ncbi:MAG: hypothetical protein LBM67_03450 [Lentimicrobiaceae bacterium]|nr:hypothetical protein [Lentimicrobiaceae bacterium]